MNKDNTPFDGVKRKPASDIARNSIPVYDRPARSILQPKARIEQNPFFTKEYIKKAPPERPPRKPFWSKLFLWTAIILVLLGLGITVVDYFSSATVSIVPVTQNARVDDEFIATKVKSADSISFQSMSLNEEKTQDVPGTVEQKVQKKATGKATIFNSYSAESQRLIKNTRLESPDHKIFRIDDSVVVPGAKMSGGKVVQPGSVVVSITADAPGSEYNIGLSDFTIPGFKGDPRYSKFTARSNTEAPLAGGFLGTTKVPTPQNLLQAQNDLKEELKKTALNDATAQIPKNFSFFPGSIVLKFEEKTQEVSTGGITKVTIGATASVFFFDTAELTKKIVDATLPKYTGATLSISNIQTLSFDFVDPVDKTVLADLTQIHFHIAGDAVFVGKIDTEKLSSGLAGKNKSDFTKIISEQNNIERASVNMFPPWASVFPSDQKKISVKIVSE